MVKLGDIAFGKKYPSHDTSVGKDTGSSRFHTGGEYTRLYTDNPDIQDIIIIVNRTNGSGKSNIFIDSNCSVAKQTLVMSCDNIITTRYIFFWLSLSKHEIEKGYIGSNHKNLSNDFVKNMIVPLPPLTIQHEIVATLDRIYQPGTTELAETLKLTNQAMDLVLAQPNGATLEPIVEAQRLMRKSAQMVADVKAQMVAIVKAIAHGCKTGTTIGNLYDTPSCKKKFNSGDMDNSGDIPFFNGKFNSPVGTHSDYSFDSEHEYFVMIKDGGGDHSSDSVGMGKFFNVKGKTAITSHNLILVPKTFNEALHKFMRIYLYCHGKEIRDKARYSLSLGSIGVKDILNFPVPNMTADQLTNANIRLGALQSQLTALENLGKQAEDNARFILESYLGSTAPSSQVSSEAHSSACKRNEDGTGCTCKSSRPVASDEEDEEEEKKPPRAEKSKEVAAKPASGSGDLTKTELAKKTVPELREIAKNLAVKSPSKMKKDELVQGILEKQLGK
jgi:restriction endonuclease S subunit